MTEETPRTTADPWLRTDNGWSCNVPWHRLRQAQAEASAVPGALREALDGLSAFVIDHSYGDDRASLVASLDAIESALAEASALSEGEASALSEGVPAPAIGDHALGSRPDLCERCARFVERHGELGW